MKRPCRNSISAQTPESHDELRETKMQIENMARKHFFSGILFILFYLFIASCSEQPLTPDVSQPAEGEIPIRLTINNPYGYSTSLNSRSQTSTECSISEIQVLVFEGGLYKYKVNGNIVGSNATSTTFNALLKSSSSPVKLYIIANANQIITDNEPPTDGNEEDIKAAVISDFTSAGLNQDFPMCGEYNIPSGLNGANLNIVATVNMLRSVARIDVLNETDNLELVTIQAFRASNRIQIIPEVLEDPEDPYVTTPSIPLGTTSTISTPKLTVSGNYSMSQLYLPESAALEDNAQTSSATCIVIGGLYNNSTDTTYYRIDFNSELPEHPFGQILRNYRYIFSLIKVNGPGRNTPEEAANNHSSNITVDVKNWSESTIFMVFDRESYFGVSSRKATLKSTSGSSTVIGVETDLTGYILQWCDENGVLTDGTPSSGIQNALFSATVSPNLSQITINALSSNTGITTRIQYMMILAGRSSVMIRIEQQSPVDYGSTFVSILNLGTQTGSFGSMFPGRTNNGDALGLRPILTNVNNFGPSGTVAIGGLWFDYIQTSNVNTTDFTRANCLALMEQYDIINVVWQSNPDAGMSGAIVDWLNGSPHRVLFVMHSDDSNNNNLLDLLGIGSSMWGGGGGNGLVYNFVPYNTKNAYFTQTGPFGSVSPTSTFSVANGNWRGINISNTYHGELIPLLTLPASQLYILAVDIDNRIVFVGDVDIYKQVGGGLNDSSGAVDYDQAKLMANVYAWAINEIILPGKAIRE